MLAGAIAVIVGLFSAATVLALPPPSPASITLTPACSDLDASSPGGANGSYSITVDGSEFNPDTGVIVTFDAGFGGSPQSYQTTTDGFGDFTIVIVAQARPAGEYLVRADDLRQREATATFRVPCTGPTIPPTHTATPTATPQTVPSLRLNPPLGPPGFVTSATGTGFPPGTTVELQWDRGLNQVPPVSITVGPSGTFTVPVLVFHHDTLGPRTLAARHVAGPDFLADGARAGFLVTPGTLQPRDFVERS